MSQADIKHSLRKMEFPACAQDALPRIESSIINRNKQTFAMQLISEFIFLEKAKEFDTRRGQSPQVVASQMSSIQEFQLIQVLIEYFSQPGPDATRNAVFISLFGTNLTPQRTKVLCRLISTSVSGSVAPLLSAAGVWMQQVGCTTAPSLEVAQNLVSDFIIFSRKTSEQLKQLPMVAPHFAANIMTAVAELYLVEQRVPGGGLVQPPDSLLDVITEWINESHSLCFASQQPVALPTGAIAMPVVTPLAGLIRWTVLAPFVSQRLIYNNLHLALLQSLSETVNTGLPTALNAQHLALIVGSLTTQVQMLIAKNIQPEKDPTYELAVDRLSQAIQVALSSNLVYGSIPQLMCALETLPPHPLLAIVLKCRKIK